MLDRIITRLRCGLHFQSDHFPGKAGVNGINLLMQMAVIFNARFTLFFVRGRQAKRAVAAAAAHGFHNGCDNDLPVARRMTKQPFITKRMEIFKARLFQPANIWRVGKFPPEGVFFLLPFLVK